MDARRAAISRVISEGRASLGIELGSTRIKAVLIGEDHAPLAQGGFDWENRLLDGLWTYRLEDVWTGVQQSFRELAREVRELYGVPLARVRALGVSAMMHGYLVFDGDGRQLTPFRTWRNTTTEAAAARLTERFGFNIPLRWSVAHLYQAILDGESHVADIAYMTTLAGYVHWELTGRKVLGVGDASGMFPIDSAENNYDRRLLGLFDELVADRGFRWRLSGILPEALTAGQDAGRLTERGARLLDPAGALPAGIPMCPPEGDAGTGMVATNSVEKFTGNISAGTSVFAMVVLEKALSKLYPEIDMVTTPAGKPVAMVHCNNCTSDLDAWVRLFAEFAELTGAAISKPALYDALYEKALEGEPDCAGLLTYNYYSGEPITGFDQGRPLLARMPDSRFTLGNLMRALLFSTMASLKLGMDILVEKEHVRLSHLTGHGGLFKTKVVGQRLMAAALSVPIAVMESAGEGGAWGMAILAAYAAHRAEAAANTASATGAAVEPLEAYLAKKVFGGDAGTRLEPDADDARGFARFMERYVAGLAIERAAVDSM
ncbi:MAG: FGGY-family carbohydrate kinase [Clostridiales bacterium]|nr:FGGY-family carbohydrate kinase [Clostridiales bacterium]